MNCFLRLSCIQLFILLLFLGLFSTESQIIAASINLDQSRNGTDASPVSPVSWVNGNSNGSQSHYIEGMSVPYRCTLSSLTSGVQITITLGYDIRNSSKNAIDYLTHYNRLETHSFTYHTTAETISPLTGTSLSSSASYTTYTIPAPSSSGSLTAGQPVTSYNALPSEERMMTLYNGTIDTIYYASQGDLTGSNSETQITIKLTPSATTAVLVWGGHIASRSDWGYSGGSPLSAGGISGSPFHMRVKSWSGGSVGNQDRSLSGDAVKAPSTSLPVELLSFDGHAKQGKNELDWATASETNSDYFVLEKSRNGITFQNITTIKAAGNTTSERYYRFTDNEPFYETTFYRLSEVDYDGTRNFYGVIVVKNRNYRSSELVIYNLQGIEMKTVKNPSASDVYSDLPDGFYIFQYVINNNVVLKRHFITSANRQ